jgi:hypothetical protein
MTDARAHSRAQAARTAQQAPMHANCEQSPRQPPSRPHARRRSARPTRACRSTLTRQHATGGASHGAIPRRTLLPLNRSWRVVEIRAALGNFCHKANFAGPGTTFSPHGSAAHSVVEASASVSLTLGGTVVNESTPPHDVPHAHPHARSAPTTTTWCYAVGHQHHTNPHSERRITLRALKKQATKANSSRAFVPARAQRLARPLPGSC